MRGDSDHPAYRLRQAEALLQSGQPLEALEILRPLLSDEPNSRSVLELAGRAYFRSAQLQRAEQTFARIVELDPTDAYARFVLGRSIERQGRKAEAVVHFRVAAALDPREDYVAAVARLSGN